MEYVVHVIDEASQHQKEEDLGKYTLLEGESEGGDQGHIVKSDYFYLVEEDSEIDAVVTVANIIRVKNSLDEPISIAEMFQKTKTNMENMSIDDASFLAPKTSDKDVVANTASELMQTSFQVERFEGDRKWMELHEISFYIMPREKILFVK